MLVGSKQDLDQERVVTAAEANWLATRLGISYTETSAHSNSGVSQCFQEIFEASIESKPEIVETVE